VYTSTDRLAREEWESGKRRPSYGGLRRCARRGACQSINFQGPHAKRSVRYNTLRRSSPGERMYSAIFKD